MPDAPTTTATDWTIGRLLDWTRKHFESRGIDDARLCAELLLAKALDCQKILLYARFNESPTDEQRAQFRELVKRAADHVPIAYLIGRKEFYSLDFVVTPAVLIPRPETELVVERALAWCKSQAGTQGSAQAPPLAGAQVPPLSGAQAPPLAKGGPGGGETRESPPEQDSDSRSNSAPSAALREPLAAPPREPPHRIDLLDIGTGSGCIAITIARREPRVHAVATDISDDALAVARQNAERHNVADRIRFVRADLLDLPADLLPQTPSLAKEGPGGVGRFDLIVSNPPYVADSERDRLPANVRDHEPHTALFAGPDGLGMYRRMAAALTRPGGPPLLKRGGTLIVEIGEGQADPVTEIFASAGLMPASRHRDLAGAERVLQFNA